MRNENRSLQFNSLGKEKLSEKLKLEMSQGRRMNIAYITVVNRG